MSRPTLILCWLILLPFLVVAAGSGRQAPAEPQTTAEIIERILELRREMEALLEVLPPELRDEIERRWQELQEAEAARAAADLPQVESTGRGEVAVAPASPEPSMEYLPRQESTAQAEVAIVPQDAPAEPEPTTTPIPVAELACGTLIPFDSNEDGVLSGADRYWRYFRLELEGGGAGLETSGPASLYELGIRTIEAELRFYSTDDKEPGHIEVDEVIHLELTGNGRATGESGVLVIDADRLARGGEVRLVDGSGTVLAGYQALGPGMALETADGGRLPLLCP